MQVTLKYYSNYGDEEEISFETDAKYFGDIKEDARGALWNHLKPTMIIEHENKYEKVELAKTPPSSDRNEKLMGQE